MIFKAAVYGREKMYHQRQTNRESTQPLKREPGGICQRWSEIVLPHTAAQGCCLCQSRWGSSERSYSACHAPSFSPGARILNPCKYHHPILLSKSCPDDYLEVCSFQTSPDPRLCTFWCSLMARSGAEDNFPLT